MSNLAFLDLNDSNLQLWHRDQHLYSPGYALLEGKQYQFGLAARDTARLHPRQVNTRYWWQLSTETLQPALGHARHHADLVHAHLLELHRGAGEPAQLLLAAPSSMQREQLALLLGIAQQCPFDIVGLANRSAVLASSYGAAGGKVFHLEVQLHQSLLTELTQSSGKIHLQRSVPLPGNGLLQLQEQLVELIAAAFIRQTRFDPRRKAQTEQQLYNALADALQALTLSDATNIEINGYRARIERSELLTPGQALFTSCTEVMGGPTSQDRLIVDPFAALLPGLQAHFSRLQLTPEVVPSDAVHKALQQHQQLLVVPDQPLSFIDVLPVLHSNQQIPAAGERNTVAVTPKKQPTHVLIAGIAQPLQNARAAFADGVEFTHNNKGWLLQNGIGLTINGLVPRPEQVLEIGDIIGTATAQKLHLILVEAIGR